MKIHMLASSKNNWFVRSATLAVWLLAGVCGVYWGSRWTAEPGKPTSLIAPPAPTFHANFALVSRFLGAKAAEKAPAMSISMSSRFMLLGVMAENSGTGAALIAVDGKPAKPFRVGSEVIPGYTLDSVKPRVATLKSSTDNSGKVVLEMTPLKK